MIIKTKLLCISYDEETDKRTSWWDEFQFDLDHYVCHTNDDDGSCLYLNGVTHPFLIQLSFEDLSKLLEKRYCFETIALN